MSIRKKLFKNKDKLSGKFVGKGILLKNGHHYHIDVSIKGPYIWVRPYKVHAGKIYKEYDSIPYASIGAFENNWEQVKQVPPKPKQQVSTYYVEYVGAPDLESIPREVMGKVRVEVDTMIKDGVIHIIYGGSTISKYRLLSDFYVDWKVLEKVGVR